MVGSGTDDSDLDLVFLVPSCEAVDDVNPIPRVQIIDRALAVNSPDLSEAH